MTNFILGGDSPQEPAKYPIGLVGEANYQDAIAGCRPGDRVAVLHETGNPYDDRALVVVTAGSSPIGYIPRTSWLRDAIHFEDKGCDATILSTEVADNGMKGVVIEVEINFNGVGQCEYRR